MSFVFGSHDLSRVLSGRFTVEVQYRKSSPCLLLSPEAQQVQVVFLMTPLQ